MLKMLDEYLVSFDNGAIIAPNMSSIPGFILGGSGEGEGPDGIPMQ